MIMMSFHRLQLRNSRLFLILACIGATEILLCFLFLDVFLSSSTNHQPEPYGASYHFITISYTDKRRLGNLLFQFATLMAFAQENKALPILEKSIPLTRYFDLQVRLVTDTNHYTSWQIFHERYAARYDPRIESLEQNQDYMLVGFYQSWRYFLHAEKVVRDRLQFKGEILHTAMRFIQYNKTDVNRDRTMHVGVHVRRGDILTAQDIIEIGYTTPEKEYYLRAMDYFREKYQKVKFIIVSDTPEWSEKNLVGTNVTHSLGYSPGVDLAILSMCDDVIMSVGTFGWWGAWLAGGTTVYYDAWPKKNTHLDRITSREDVFPEHWIPMN